VTTKGGGRIALGLISGTSVDAIEAAVCRVWGTGKTARLELLHHHTHPFTAAQAKAVRDADTAAQLCRLNFTLGAQFAKAARAALQRAKVPLARLDVVGSHGQTIAHQPGATLQLGEASVIAEVLGVPVITDFRVRDVAAGGEGAPLVPYADWALFRLAGSRRAFQNIGGIANVSIVSDRLEDTVAFDTGPGNMLIDALTRKYTRGRQAYDENGRLAARGQVLPALLESLCRLGPLRRPPPRSFGCEQFGDALAEALWREHHQHPLDLLATVTAFTVEATARAWERWVLPGRPIEGVYISGGGSRNPLLFDGLRRRLAPLPVKTLDALGFPEGAKEAACFALLACEHLAGTPANIPRATGARRRVVLGKRVP
jgi:anhydro-N-acetylmuramic acid kinase